MSKMKKFFVVSDIHSFFTPLKKALDGTGFDPSNEEHWLVICGDAFDRGNESWEVLHFIMSLERKIIIKGNHDLLLDECCLRGFPYNHDYSNGTVKTINEIGGAGEGKPFNECCDVTWNKLARYRELLVNYFETKKFIFVHSWIPCKLVSKVHPADKWVTLVDKEYMVDWRDANAVEWEDAMWGNPFNMYLSDLNKTGKTIVFGHWHCSAGHKLAGNCNDEFKSAIWEPFYGNGIIAIDRCTAHTGECNVIVLEDEFLEAIE